jgi:beta-glucosidase
VNWIYAPVCDIDVLPENPIVGTRAFGGEPQRVGEQVYAWIRACQEQGVLACAKHFPGHGRTLRDSHATLPVVDASRAQLYAEDLVPFRAALNADVAAVMTAHVSYPALDPGGAPATLSAPILRGLLREEMRFRGLIVTDALIMEGVKADGREGEATVRAIDAGCDLLLYPENLEAVTTALEQAVVRGPLTVERIAASQDRRTHWAEWARDREAGPVTDADRASAAGIAMRAVFLVRGAQTRLSGLTEILVVDDDIGGPYPPPSREPFFAELRGRGVDVVRVDAPGHEPRAPLVIALFGDIRGWKGRSGYSAATRDAVRGAIAAARALGRSTIVVQFSHPRLSAEIADAETVVCAWGGERAMQEAAARRLVAGVGVGVGVGVSE